jgi:hypothetical protein
VSFAPGPLPAAWLALAAREDRHLAFLPAAIVELTPS